MDLINLKSILEAAIQKEASDVHLLARQPPIFRIHGDLTPTQSPPFTEQGLKNLLFGILTDEQKAMFLENKELDFSYRCIEGYQFRVNMHYAEGNPAAVIRITSGKAQTFEELNLPAKLKDLAKERKGLIIISGSAGSGKSTSLTAILDLINNERKSKIITIEDPIEFHHTPQKSLFLQREVGPDTHSFARALKYALRQDPDIVVVGEMRDPESITMAITTAETGHLVFTTVHAPNAIETINRIIDVYPPGFREQVLSQLSSNLIAIISQTLIPRKDGAGRILATEVLIANVAVQNLMRRGAFAELRGVLNAAEVEGMHSLELCLSDLFKKRLISEQTAKDYAKFQESLQLSDVPLFNQSAISPDKTGQAATTPQSEQRILKKLNKILIIDAFDKDVPEMARRIKEKFECRILAAGEGREGISLLQTEKPDAILIDTMLPDARSFDLCRHIKSLDHNDCKIIMITRNLKLTDGKDAKDAGADDFVIKTNDYRLVLQSLEKHFTITKQ